MAGRWQAARSVEAEVLIAPEICVGLDETQKHDTNR
jgi:hypothetical protein